jgi:molybdopterin molybdotransferase
MTTVAEAVALIDTHVRPWPAEIVSIDAAAGRVSTEDVAAERDIPAFDRVTMDGIAIAWAGYANGTREFTSIGTQAAGVPPFKTDSESECVRVMTGAVLPRGTDTVVPIERIALEGRLATIEANAVIEQGQFVHRRGSDRRGGSIVLKAGTRLGAPEIAVLASVGKASVSVCRQLRIAVISTGDELVGVDEPVAPHQIRSSNGRAIEASLTLNDCGTVTRRRLRDEPDNLLAELQMLHDTHDALVLSGGVSMGDFDFVPGALKHLGAKLVFHRIEQKPGRPMWFGISRSEKPIFALPGNPVSTLACMTRYVVPALRRALGYAQQPEYAILADAPSGGPERFTWFVPVTLKTNTNGELIAATHQINTSGDFSSLAATDGIAQLDPGDENRAAGCVVQVFRW